MKRTTMARIAAFAALSTLATSIAFAKPAPTTAPWLNIDGEVNVDTTGTKTGDYELGLRVDASLRLEVLLREGIKAVVKARLIEDLRNAGYHTESETQNIEQLIEEAYIEVETDKVSGLPRAIVKFGKHSMAFGQEIRELPFFRDALLDKLTNEREMIGVSVTLPTQFLKIIDEVSMSLYESGAGDFKISESHGVSIKLSKRLSQRIQAQVSALMKETAGNPERETRVSFGFVFDSSNGRYKVWTQGLVFDKNPTMPNTKYGAQVGGSMKLGRGTVVVDYQYLEEFASELAVAYNLPVGHNLTLSPEIRHQWKENGSDETIVGMRARVNFDRQMKKKIKRS